MILVNRDLLLAELDYLISKHTVKMDRDLSHDLNKMCDKITSGYYCVKQKIHDKTNVPGVEG